MALAMALGFAPAGAAAAPVADHGRVSLVPNRRRRHLVVRALGEEEEVGITSMINHSSNNNSPLTELGKSISHWGRAVHQHFNKFFHELADGSVLVSFGAAPPEVRVPVKLPPRLPSRYSKQYPFTAQRIKKPELPAVETEQPPVKKFPRRLPSTFLKQSPVTGLPRRRGVVDGGGRCAAFQDVHVEVEPRTFGLVRPVTAFARKSPVFTGGRRRKKTEPDSAGEEVTSEAKPVIRSRPVSTFTRKFPITLGKLNRRKRHGEPTVTGTGSEQLLDTSPNEKPDSNLKPGRPKTSFIRNSPISHRSSRRWRNKPRSTKVSEDEIVRIVLRAASAVSRGEGTQVAEQTKDEETVVVVDKQCEGNGSALSDAEVVETDVETSDDEGTSTSCVDESYLSALTLHRLKRIAKSRGLRGYSRLRKAELVQLLKQS